MLPSLCIVRAGPAARADDAAHGNSIILEMRHLHGLHQLAQQKDETCSAIFRVWRSAQCVVEQSIDLCAERSRHVIAGQKS